MISHPQNILQNPMSRSTQVPRIVLVEDNELNRQLLSEYLAYFGYNVLSLASGSELFTALPQFCPNLILLDLKLPDIDGYTVLEQLQQDSTWQSVPVFVVSAFAFQSDRTKAMTLGAKQYFVKPMNLKDLMRAIQESVNQPSDTPS